MNEKYAICFQFDSIIGCFILLFDADSLKIIAK